MPLRILLTGRPGIGKTTVVVRTVELLREAGLDIAGFVTEEVRSGGSRDGFDIVVLDGTRAPLARVGLESEVTVGRYGVAVEAVREHGLPALRLPADVTVIDEIAPMELACPGFEDAVEDLLGTGRHLLATVHASDRGYIGRIKEREDTDVIEVARANRDDLPQQLADRLTG